MREEDILQLQKNRNYYYKVDGEITRLYYRLTDNTFAKHMTYCKDKDIDTRVNKQWVEILIDTEDFDIIKNCTLTVIGNHMSTYCRNIKEYWAVKLLEYINKKITSHILSRIIIKPPKNLVCDHKNRNVFDNRKSNLQCVTVAENNQNKISYNNSKSGIRGISKTSRNKGTKYEKEYWNSLVRKDKKIVFMKTFPYTDEGLEQAKIAVVEARNKYFINNLNDKQ